MLVNQATVAELWPDTTKVDEIVTPGASVTTAVPIFEESATLAAVTVTFCGPIREAGAVYSPEFEIVPRRGLIDQATAVVDIPETYAANWMLSVGESVAVDGVMLTLNTDGSTDIFMSRDIPNRLVLSTTVI